MIFKSNLRDQNNAPDRLIMEGVIYKMEKFGSEWEICSLTEDFRVE